MVSPAKGTSTGTGAGSEATAAAAASSGSPRPAGTPAGVTVSDLDRQIAALRRCEYLKESEVKAICSKAREILIDESNVQRVDAPVTVSIFNGGAGELGETKAWDESERNCVTRRRTSGPSDRVWCYLAPFNSLSPPPPLKLQSPSGMGHLHRSLDFFLFSLYRCLVH